MSETTLALIRATHVRRPKSKKWRMSARTLVLMKNKTHKITRSTQKSQKTYTSAQRLLHFFLSQLFSQHQKKKTMKTTPTLNRRKKVVSLLALNLFVVSWSSTMQGCYSWTTTTATATTTTTVTAPTTSTTPLTRRHRIHGSSSRRSSMYSFREKASSSSSSVITGFQNNRDIITHLHNHQDFESMASSMTSSSSSMTTTWSPSPLFGLSSSDVTAAVINHNRHHQNYYQKHIRAGHQLIQQARTLLRTVVSSVNERGTRIHVICAIANMLVIPIMLNINIPSSSLSSVLLRQTQQYSISTTTTNAISHACMIFGFIGMVYDNLVTAAGKYLVRGGGENTTTNNDNKLLRILTKGRYLFHGMIMPLLLVPIVEVFSKQQRQRGVVVGNMLKGVLLCIASMEMFDWIHYDEQRFIKVDNTRSTTQHVSNVVAGTIKYTSPDIMKCVIPAIVATLIQIGSGMYMILRQVQQMQTISLSCLSSGPLLVLLAGLTALVSATAFAKRPDIQLFLEPASLVMIWSALLTTTAATSTRTLTQLVL